MISEKLIEKEIATLEKSIQKKQRFVNDAPEGKLKCRKSHNSFYWYIVKTNMVNSDISNQNNEESLNSISQNTKTLLEGADKSPDKSSPNNKNQLVEYINKNNQKLASKMALKGMYEQDLLDEKQELKALRSYLRNRSKFERREKYLNRSEGVYELLEPRLKSKWSPEVQTWLDDITECEDLHPESRTHRCNNGLWVRSKSEQSIANTLLEHNIPFKYEQPLMLDGQLCMPDFTVLNVRTWEEYRWEHFGMMGDPNYLRDNTYKIERYLRNGYIPFVNFITTYEVDNSGVDGLWINKIIETYLK